MSSILTSSPVGIGLEIGKVSAGRCLRVNLDADASYGGSDVPRETKLTGIFKRTIQSSMFWVVIEATAMIAFSAILLTGALGAATVFLAPAVGVGLVALGVTIYLLRKQLIHEASLIMSSVRKSKWMNQIDDKLMLGALPLRSEKHHEILTKQHNIQTVCSVVERFETRLDAIVGEPVRQETWEDKGVTQKFIEVEDGYPLKAAQLDEGADFVHGNISQGKTTYVHCRAGVERSASVVAAYLMKYRQKRLGITPDMTDEQVVDQTINFIRVSRPITIYNKKQLKHYYENFVMASKSLNSKV